MFRNRLTQEQAIALAQGRKIKMRGMSLVGLDLRGLDLSDADMRFSNFEDVNFSNCNLSNADFSFSGLSRVDFTGANLENVNLSFCGLHDVQLTDAITRGVNFSFSGVSNSNYTNANEPASLPDLLYENGWLGRLIGLMLGAIMFYGISGIIYFTNLILSSESVGTQQLVNQYIVAQNVLGGILTVSITYAFSNWLDKTLKNNLSRHLLLSVVVFAAYSLFAFFLSQFVINNMFIEIKKAFMHRFFRDAPGYLYALCPVIVANAFYYFHRQSKQITQKITDQEFQLVQMEGLKTKAELEALQAKINPHFLYNALNSVASLVHIDPDKAERMTMLLSKFFRYTTSAQNRYYETIASELDMVQTYLDVEKVRFDERLEYVIEIQDEKLRGQKIPRFLMQPLVENAIKHGISKIANKGCIRIVITQKDQQLLIYLHDNGPAFPEQINAGYGLQSIQDKLRLLCGNNAKMELVNGADKHIKISIPLQDKAMQQKMRELEKE